MNLVSKYSAQLSIYTAAALAFSGCRTVSPAGPSNFQRYEIDNGIHQVDFRICDETMPKTRRGRNRTASLSKQYKDRAYAHIVELLSVRTGLLTQPDDQLLSNQDLTEDDLKALLPKSCTEDQESWWSKLFIQNPKRNSEIIESFYENWKKEDIIPLTFPSHIVSEGSSCGSSPEILENFRKETYASLYDELDRICEAKKLDEKLVTNPTIAASLIFRYPDEVRKINNSYCAMLKINHRSEEMLEKWDAISPWLFAGGSLAAGALVGLITKNAAGFAAGSFVVDMLPLTEHLLRNRHLISQLQYLNDLEKKAAIPNCSKEQINREKNALKSLLISDGLGIIISISLGFAAPGIGRGISAALRSGKAGLYSVAKNSRHAFYFVIPQSNYFYRLPSRKVLITSIKAATNRVSLLASKIWPDETEMLNTGISDAINQTLRSLNDLAGEGLSFLSPSTEIDDPILGELFADLLSSGDEYLIDFSSDALKISTATEIDIEFIFETESAADLHTKINNTERYSVLADLKLDQILGPPGTKTLFTEDQVSEIKDTGEAYKQAGLPEAQGQLEADNDKIILNIATGILEEDDLVEGKKKGDVVIRGVELISHQTQFASVLQSGLFTAIKDIPADAFEIRVNGWRSKGGNSISRWIPEAAILKSPKLKSATDKWTRDPFSSGFFENEVQVSGTLFALDQDFEEEVRGLPIADILKESLE